MKKTTLSSIERIPAAEAAIRTEFAAFLLGPARNRIVGDDIITVYTRKGNHLVDGQLRACLDIARIAVSDEFQRRGLGMRLIDYMHSANPYPITYIENVLNDTLYARLKKDGWHDTQSVYDRCVYKTTTHYV